MIGGFDNDWTLRLTDSLPFRFVKAADDGRYEIFDARSATAPVYSIDTSVPYSALTQDYGIVARFLNPITERPTVIVAGLGTNGTEAATSLVTSNYLFKQFAATAPKDGESEILRYCWPPTQRTANPGLQEFSPRSIGDALGL